MTDVEHFQHWLDARGIELLPWQKEIASKIFSQPPQAGVTFLLCRMIEFDLGTPKIVGPASTGEAVGGSSTE